jgi:hypothetical protein
LETNWKKGIAMQRHVWITTVRSLIFAVLVLPLALGGCSDDGGGGSAHPMDTATNTVPDSMTSNDTASADGNDSVTAADSADTGGDTTSTPPGDVLRLSQLPNFRVPLPSSLSRSASNAGGMGKKAVTPEELDEVQSQGYYLLQEEQIFTVEIYAMRGLITFLETYTLENDVPEDQVVTLGIQTGVKYEGGPMDGQSMNPHVDMLSTDNSYEGIDLGQLRWWQVGEGIHVAWHITDTTFADFPYWLIDIAPAKANPDVDTITIAAFRQQWDGTQSTTVVRYLTHDESTGQTRMYQRTAGYNMGLGEGNISYRFIDFIEEASLEMDTEEPVDTDDTDDTESGIAPDTGTETEIEAGTETESVTGMETGTETETGGAADSDVNHGVQLYLENGEFNPVDMSQTVYSQVVAVGDDSGGGVAAYSIPALMWDDSGTEIQYEYYFREIYNSEGNLVMRGYSPRFDGVCELSDFSGFIADTEAINYYGLSPTAAPEAIYRRYTFNLTTSESTYEISLEAPEANNWTAMSTNDAVLRTIWKQNEMAGSDWTPGDVVYQADLQADLDCSVAGETNCTISVLTPYAVYPAPTDVFGKTFYAENQWPIRYLQAATAPALIKVESLDEWPYLRTWLESDDNDQYDYDNGEILLPGDIYDVYFYTASGELVDATMPMLYRAGEAPPETVVFDAAAAEAVQYVNDSLENLMTGFVADIAIPHDISLPDEDTFLAYFEGDVPVDTGADTATEANDTETGSVTPDSASETTTDSAIAPDTDSTSATP